ncbi:phage terminase large subunit [Agrobacterium leguminum]|uniref:phage terminase large subunit n=1 Tax=Agrobacterium leguminum TaxID=2792015 RepID=UPI0022B81ACA|nr:phage terminase large subunit [Agrobacterium leguminum]MCZ7931078.1 phage terminase large subunit [Agrobacterium leguminum]
MNQENQHLTDEQKNRKREKELTQLIDIFRDDIALFADTVFGSKLRPKQIEFAEAFRDKSQITFRGGVGFGKTHVSAVMVWWSIICHNRVTVTIFGPGEKQIKSGIWKELTNLYEQMTPVFKQAYSITATKAYRNTAPSECFFEYKPASKDDTASARGIHAPFNFIVVDEADGVDDEVFTEALENVLVSPTEVSKLVLVSNPSKNSGYFYDTWHHPQKSAEWTKVHGNIFDFPNVTEEHLKTLETRYGGKDSRQYRVMVLGEFPEDSAEGLIPRSLVEIAVNQTDVIPAPSEAFVWGLDPAGDGQDRSVLCIRQGRTLQSIETYQNLDSIQLAYKIRDVYQRTPANQRPTVIAIDTIGVGFGVYSALKEFGLPVKGIKVSNKPTRQPERYRNIRDQIWWETKEWFETEDVVIPKHDDLIFELTNIRYNTDNGKICVEAKKDLKKRSKGKSPDHADALCLTFAVSSTRYASKYGFSKPLTYDNLSMYE